MKPLPLAIATRCLNQPLKSALVLAAQFGAGGVQLDCRNELKADELSATGRRELLHRIEEMRLSIASLDFPLRRGLLDPDRLDAPTREQLIGRLEQSLPRFAAAPFALTQKR